MCTFIKFPLDPAVSKQWLEISGSEELSNNCKEQGGYALINRKICSIHFVEDLRIQRRPDRGLQLVNVPVVSLENNRQLYTVCNTAHIQPCRFEP